MNSNVDTIDRLHIGIYVIKALVRSVDPFAQGNCISPANRVLWLIAVMRERVLLCVHWNKAIDIAAVDGPAIDIAAVGV